MPPISICAHEHTQPPKSLPEKRLKYSELAAETGNMPAFDDNWTTCTIWTRIDPENCVGWKRQDECVEKLNSRVPVS